METSIELRYAGVVIGKATVAGEIDEGGLFLPVPDPLPVGTKVTLKIDDRPVDGRVISVSESADPAKCGMKIRIGGAAATSTGPVASASASPPATASADAPPAEAAGAVAAVVDAGSDLSTAQSDGSGDGAPGAEDSSGQSGGSGGRRKKRRR